MTASARDVAAALRERLPGLPVKKLHKLLYYCQGHHLAHFGTPLFSETISAWDMGPVVGEVWHLEKYPWTYPTGELHTTPAAPLDNAELGTISYVVSRYGRRYGWELESQTHGEMPWQRANAQRAPRGSVPIQLSWILEHFQTVTEAERQEDIPFDQDDLRGLFADALERDRARAPHADGPDELSELERMRDEVAARLASA